jgi:hypothetical protein
VDAYAEAPRSRSADEERAQCLIVRTSCANAEVHRQRVHARERHIPKWYELGWEHVEPARDPWAVPREIDLTLEASDSVEENVEWLRRLIDGSL